MWLDESVTYVPDCSGSETRRVVRESMCDYNRGQVALAHGSEVRLYLTRYQDSEMTSWAVSVPATRHTINGRLRRAMLACFMNDTEMLILIAVISSACHPTKR